MSETEGSLRRQGRAQAIQGAATGPLASGPRISRPPTGRPRREPRPGLSCSVRRRPLWQARSPRGWGFRRRTVPRRTSRSRSRRGCRRPGPRTCVVRQLRCVDAEVKSEDIPDLRTDVTHRNAPKRGPPQGPLFGIRSSARRRCDRRRCSHFALGCGVRDTNLGMHARHGRHGHHPTETVRRSLLGRRHPALAHRVHPHPQQVAGLRSGVGRARPHGGGGQADGGLGARRSSPRSRAPRSRWCACPAARR